MNGDNERLKRHQPARRSADTQLPWWKVMLSVLAAAFGVQSERNRQRDFSQGRAWQFIVAAVVFTAVLVLCIILAVHWALQLQP